MTEAASDTTEDPAKASPTAADPVPADGAAGPEDSAASAPPEPLAQATEVGSPVVVVERLAPGEERLGAPLFAAKKIADPETNRPSRAFLLVVATASLVADVASKLWAEKALDGYPGFVSVVDDHLMFILAKNKGGAWGLLQGQSENVRRPFFLLVSVAAIAFIMTLYRRLTPRQHALRWGLPLVLGGALGNVFDRIRYGHVIDFIDYRAEWVRSMNAQVAKRVAGHYVTDHWPTFNIADVAICVGVGLMAVDMFTSRRGPAEPAVVVAGMPLPESVPAVEAPPEGASQAEVVAAEATGETASTDAAKEEGVSDAEPAVKDPEETKETA
jgi:signal peptidase II